MMNKTDDDVNKTCERNADEHAPVAVILTDCSSIRAEEGERGAEEYRASALGAEQVYDGADARAEQCGCGVCLQAIAGDKQRYEQRSAMMAIICWNAKTSVLLNFGLSSMP